MLYVLVLSYLQHFVSFFFSQSSYLVLHLFPSKNCALTCIRVGKRAIQRQMPPNIIEAWARISTKHCDRLFLEEKLLHVFLLFLFIYESQ